jgi:type VI protein secretion system component Hcp
MRPFLPVIGIIAALLTFAGPAAAAELVLAKIGNIPGGSQRIGYAGWTEIESYGLTTATPSGETATGPVRTQLSMQRVLIRKHPGSVTMTKRADVGSSGLRAASSNGQVLPSVELKIFKAQGSDGRPFLLQSYSFLNAKISSYSNSGSAGGMTESMTFDFADMRQVQAPPQSDTGQ